MNIALFHLFKKNCEHFTCTEHFHIYLCLCNNPLQLSATLKGAAECKGNRYQSIQNAKVAHASGDIYIQAYKGDF